MDITTITKHKKTHTHTHTTDDIESAECDVAEAVEGPFPCLRVKFVNEDLGLLVHHLQEVGQNGEMEGGREELSSAPPFIPRTEREREIIRG